MSVFVLKNSRWEGGADHTLVNALVAETDMTLAMMIVYAVRIVYWGYPAKG